MIRNFFWLTDIQFGKLKPHLPTDTRGRPRVDDRRVISGGACERFLALSSDIFRYAEYASMIAFKHFSSKRLSAKDSDRGILRSPKIGEQLQQRRNLTVWMTVLENRCSEKS
jgi:hypothetical protein